jgi:hypothetical protein
MRPRHLFILVPCLIIIVHGLLFAFSAGPLPQLTGGFGEKTCVMCHNSYDLNQGRTVGGVFHILGVPRTYTEGTAYPITVVIGQPGQSRWGFELSVRHMGSGAQAGRLSPVDDMTQVKEAGGIQYIEHTSVGNREHTPDGPVEFRFNWVAPDSRGGPVLFNAAGNAANSSGDPTGDYIYTAGAYSGVEGTYTTTGAVPEKNVERRPLRVSTNTRLLDLPAPKAFKRGEWFFTVQHRFLGPLKDASLGNALGVDQGGNINLELGYAPTDRLSVAVTRARFAVAQSSFAPAIISFAGAYSIHNNEKSPWKMSLVGGIEGQNNFLRQYSPYLQLATSWDYKRLRTYVVPTMVFNSRSDTEVRNNPNLAIHPEHNDTFSLGFGGNFALHPRYSVSAEWVPRLAGFGGFGDAHSAVTIGFNVQTWRHVFTVLVSRSRDFTPAHYGVNADGPWALGFNIYRQFR